MICVGGISWGFLCPLVPNQPGCFPVKHMADIAGKQGALLKLHPGRLTWNPQITHLERKMIFQTSMTMFHVNLQGCSILLENPGPISRILQDARSIGHMHGWEKFRVRDAGGGNMALHNDNHNRFLRMSDRTMDPREGFWEWYFFLKGIGFLGGGNSNIFGIFIPIWGFMIQFD